MPQRFPSPLSNQIRPFDAQFDISTTAGAAFRDAWETNPFISALTSLELNEARGLGYEFIINKEDRIRQRLEEDPDNYPILSLEEQQEQIDAVNLTKVLNPKFGETQESLDMIIRMKQEELARQTVISMGKDGFAAGAANIGAGFAASLLDPVNLAAGFVPIIGPARYAGLLARQATTARRFGVRAATGAAEGAAATALIEPLVLLTTADRQADYDIYDTFANLAFGTVLGGGIHGVGGYFKDKISPSINARTVMQSIDNAEPEARQAAFNGAIGQIAGGRVVQGIDFILRESVETSSAVGRVLDARDPLDMDAVLRAGQEDTGPRVLPKHLNEGEPQPGFPVVANEKTFKRPAQANKFAEALQQEGFDATVRQVDGGFEVDVNVETNIFARTPDGAYLSFRDKKRANKARTRLKKEGALEEAAVVKIGDEFFIIDASNKRVADLVTKNADRIDLPMEVPGIKTDAVAEGSAFSLPSAPRIIPDIEYGLDQVRLSYAPENRIFDLQEREAQQRVDDMESTLIDEYDEAAALRETDELLVEVERLKAENADDPLLSEAVKISERELADGDEIIANTRQTSAGFRQAATCILGGVD
tara:strand:+ start:407 stop:2188 length:1782 start_codon:yes stop_codon:yes gene_type:complete